MHFTQEDYKKIEDWLNKRSIKDTEFQEASPLKGDEIIAITQKGYNRKINVKDLVDQLLNLGIEDFINVTSSYDSPNISLEEAIHLIPDKSRKEGQVITFLNKEGKWGIYQFTGKLNQWNNITLWNNPFDWENYVVNSILPDEEDLTKSAPDDEGNAYLSLKDRKYEPDKYSGLGRKILRRRVVEIEDPIYGTKEKNLLLQDDFDSENTIYEIRYDFDLNNQEITIPEGCVLDFQGGSLNNGNIIGSNTNIVTNSKHILSSINIDGTWNINCVYSSWVKILNKKDCVSDLRTIFKLGKGGRIIIEEGDYYVSFSKNDDNAFIIEDDNTTVTIKGNIYVNPNALTHYCIITIQNCTNIEINGGGNLYGDVENHIGDSGEWGMGIVTKGASNVKITDINLSYFWGDGIAVSYESTGNIDNNIFGKNIYIDKVTCSYCRRLGLSITGGQYVYITNSNFIKNGTIRGTLPKAGIDIEANYDGYTDHIYIDNCRFDTTGLICSRYVGEGVDTRTNYVSVKNCNLTNTYIMLACNNANISNCTMEYLWLDHSSNSNVYDNTIKEFLYLSSINTNIHFYKNMFKPTTRSHGYSSFVMFADESELTNIKFDDCFFDLSNPDGVISLHAKNNYIGDNINLNNCIIYTPDRYFSWAIGDVLNSKIIVSRIHLTNNIRGNIKYINNKINTKDTPIVVAENIDNNSSVSFFSNSVYTSSLVAGLVQKYNYSANIYTVNNSFNNGLFLSSGKTEERPNLIAVQAGFVYYDTDLKKIIIWSGERWQDILGRALWPDNQVGSYDNKPPFNITYPGYQYNNTTTKNLSIVNRTNDGWIDVFGFTDKLHFGPKDIRPTGCDIGHFYYDFTINKPIWWNGNNWIDATGNDSDIKNKGIYDDKPKNPSLGTAYFCTDRQTVEGATNGIMIYYKGNDIWVDALGRVVK